MENKHSLIIGGTKGTGLVLANHFLAKGHKVTIVGRNKPKIENKAFFQQLDLENLEIIPKVMLSIFENQGKFDNIIFLQRFRGKENKMEGEFNVSIKATTKIIDAAEEKWSENNNKSVVFVSSIASKFIIKGQDLSYHIAKTSLNQLSKYYAVKLSKKGIRVNTIIPCTFIKPESKDYYLGNQKIQEIYKEITPLGRMLTSEDIVSTISFLCSKESSILTGQEIVLDGGISCVAQEALANKLWSLEK